MKKKKFDCVEMKHRAARQIYQELKDLTVAQQVEYWRKKSEELGPRPITRSKVAKSKHAA